jgi:hypothetical protein
MVAGGTSGSGRRFHLPMLRKDSHEAYVPEREVKIASGHGPRRRRGSERFSPSTIFHAGENGAVPRRHWAEM